MAAVNVQLAHCPMTGMRGLRQQYSICVGALIAVSTLCSSTTDGRSEEQPFPSLYIDSAPFTEAIEHAKSLPHNAASITGITVPHHLVAADLIAAGFRLVEGRDYDKVVVLFPDHFRRTRLPFATTRRNFNTVYGPIETRRHEVEQLLQSADVEESELFERDHGIGAVLPFLKHALPNAEIVPIAVSIDSTVGQWDRLVAVLAGVVSPSTLVVQSTDFSHYLPLGEAILRDQQTLNVIAAGTPVDIARLSQPSSLDSRGAQYIQLRLQREFFHANPRVLFNSNQQAYVDVPLARTTSYVVQIYEPDRIERAASDLPGSKVYCFAGDTFFGRRIAPALSDPDIAASLRREMRDLLGRCRLIVNLEGVVVSKIPANLPPLRLAMPKGLVTEWLHDLNVEVVSIANNHAMDLGKRSFDVMVRELKRSGVNVLRRGEVADLGPFRLLALTDVENSTKPFSELLTVKELERVKHLTARPPLFAFVHWGAEYAATPTTRTQEIADALRQAAVPLVIGTHPHVASEGLNMNAGGTQLVAYSLGNFLFDSPAKLASGAILEVRVFDQGTFFARFIRTPQFGEIAGRAKKSQASSD
jgi:AmmeMemoRadiSam system protein B